MTRHVPHWTGFCTRCGVHKAKAGWIDCLSDIQLVNVVAISHLRADARLSAALELQPQQAVPAAPSVVPIDHKAIVSVPIHEPSRDR